MNWDKPLSKEEFMDAINLLGKHGYKFKERHTGIKNLLWSDFGSLQPELRQLTLRPVTEQTYVKYVNFCRMKNSKLSKVLE